MIALLKDRGITDARLLRAMSIVKRHVFVPEPFTNRAYDDSALPIGKQQTISQPYTVAFMTQVLGVEAGDRILEVGTGSGYQAAVLAEMGAKVFTIERHAELFERRENFWTRWVIALHRKSAMVQSAGASSRRYNGIIVTAGAPDVPEPLLNQLVDGGKLVIPVGDQETQNLLVVTRNGAAI